MVIKASDFYLDLAWDKNADSVTLHTPTDNVGIQTIPEARLHLPAGTISPFTAPLKFTQGSLLSSVENGAFEYDGAYLYITSQNQRKKLLDENSIDISGTDNFIPKFLDNGITESIIQDSTGKISINGDLELASGKKYKINGSDLTYTDVNAAPSTHALVGTNHTASGLTIGHFLKATSATQFGFAAHGLTASDVGAAPTNRTITAGNGLTGGGDLTADRTLTLGTPSTLTGATTNAVTTSSHTHAITLTPADVNAAPSTHALVGTNHTASGLTIGHFLKATSATQFGFGVHGLTAADVGAAPTNRTITAGNGLTGGGDLTADRTVSMGVPGTLSSTTSNAVTTSSHTHSISGFSLDSHNHGTGTGNYIAKYTNATTFGNSSITDDGSSVGIATANLNFGSSARQMINLYSSVYGIGVQNYVQYFRSGYDFSWFKRGVHSSNRLDAGSGGTILMVLNENGYLGLGGLTSLGDMLDINGNARIRNTNGVKFGGTNSTDAKFSIQYNSSEDCLDFVYL